MNHPHKPLLATLAFTVAALAQPTAYAGCSIFASMNIHNLASYAFTPMHVETCPMAGVVKLSTPDGQLQLLKDVDAMDWEPQLVGEVKAQQRKAQHKQHVLAMNPLPYTHTEQLIADAGWVLRVRAMPPSSYQTDPAYPQQKNFSVAFLQVLEALKGDPAAIVRVGGDGKPMSKAQSWVVTYPIQVIAKKDQQHAPKPYVAPYNPKDMPLRMHGDARARLHLRPQDVPGILAPVWCDSTQSLFEGAEYLMILDAQGYAQNIPRDVKEPLPFTCGAPRLERIQPAQDTDAASSPDPWYAWVKTTLKAKL